MTGTVIVKRSDSKPAATLCKLSPAPLAKRWIEVNRLRHLCSRTGSVVLSFDDGPGEHLTVKVLDLLALHEVRATFFLLGSRAARHPEIVDRIVREGHEVGCHSHWHLSAWRVPSWEAIEDIDRGYESLGRWVPPNGLFRPPHGKSTMATRRAIQRRGASIGWWTIDSGDTAEVLPVASRTASRLERDRGGVVLLHDFDRKESEQEAKERAAFVLQAMLDVFEVVARSGLTFRTLGSVLAKTREHVRD